MKAGKDMQFMPGFRYLPHCACLVFNTIDFKPGRPARAKPFEFFCGTFQQCFKIRPRRIPSRTSPQDLLQKLESGKDSHFIWLCVMHEFNTFTPADTACKIVWIVYCGYGVRSAHARSRTNHVTGANLRPSSLQQSSHDHDHFA